MSTQTLAQPSKAMESKMTDPAAAATQALDRRPAVDAQIIRSPQEFVAQLEKWQRANYHVLSPFANFNALPPHWGILPTKVTIDPNADKAGAGEVYQDGVFTKGDDVALTKMGLAKIAMAAGMTVESFRTDPRTISNLWEVKATARFIGINGTPQSRDAMEEFDLRDGSERAKQMQPKQLQQARIKGLRNCEARACNAAVRNYGIKQKYTKAELQKPFVVIQMIYLPDMNNPIERQQVAERALAGSSTLYGHGPAALPAAASEPLDIIGATGGDVIEHAASTATPSDPGRLIVKVDHDMEAGTFDLTVEGGETLSTRSKEIADAALVAKKAGQRVRINVDDEGLIKHFEVAGEPKL